MGSKEHKQKADQVDNYMEKLQHPFKQEVERLRSIILNANPKLQERVKWNSPSFFYIKDLAAFNLRAKGYVQIIFIFYDGNMIEDPSLLQGNWKDRREARFHSMADIEAKQSALEQLVNNWVKLIESK
ncbi:hypothetical protein ASU31_14390 [Pedobacter ginsenosidimutans]|uniref:YdhG-like domain-containing protein n=1 Tax=Pedobacter ginsenosidimutans TaxID=687842 RepID=A0A0T5VPA2_9SPHI|nr:DUF1801 domain-containing protein [Pedobacter ginsenosidimutans]KRT15535.1 hypothetical protein ASU31_14390 [Pedobacter ginsenosidimutans]